jgi:chitin-binding protein
VNLEAHVLNHPGAEKGYLKQDMNNSNQDVTMNLTNVTPGHHMLKYYATNKAGTLFAQDVLDMMLEGEATSGDTGKSDFIFPDNLPLIRRAPWCCSPKTVRPTSASHSRTAGTASSTVRPLPSSSPAWVQTGKRRGY